MCDEIKIECCKRTDPPWESPQVIPAQIRRVDKQRAKTHALLCPYPWGDVRGYDLCINTSAVEIKEMIPSICAYATKWFER